MALARLEIVNVACWRENQAVASHQAKATQADSRTRTHAHKQQSSIFEVAAGASAGAGAGAAVWLWGEAGSEGTGRGRRRVADRHLVHTHARSRCVFGLRHVCRAGLIRPAEYGQPAPPNTSREPPPMVWLPQPTDLIPGTRSLIQCYRLDSVVVVAYGLHRLLLHRSLKQQTANDMDGAWRRALVGYNGYMDRLVIVIDRRDYYDGGASSRPPFLNSAKNSCGSIG